MHTFREQRKFENIVSLIAIIIFVGTSCSSVQGSLIPGVPTINSNPINHEPVVPDDVNTRDEENYNAEQLSNLEALPEYINVTEHPGELCNRVCVSGQQLICYFKFTLEYYQAMGVACGKCNQGVEKDCNNPQCIVGDGVEKGVMSINRQVPGPAIHVCKNDLVVVDVQNNAHGSAAAIHWHGIHMRETPHMDGVPFVTQCPIPFANTFRYKFHATEPGTQFYHSHSGHHKMNGQYGALIVRRPEEPLSSLYDFDLAEHNILISDYMHAMAEQFFPGHPSALGIFPDSLLINGRGTYTHPETKERTKVHPTVYEVIPGKRYRFRIINSVSHACPVQLQIEDHDVSIIASDSYDVFPSKVNTLVSNAGERYDIVVEANRPIGDYWIRVRGMGICSIFPTESYALLRYRTKETDINEEHSPIRSFPTYDAKYPNGIILNHPNATCWGGENDHCVTELTAWEDDEVLRNAVPDHKFFLSFQNIPVPNEHLFQPGQYPHFSNLNSNLTLVGAINGLTLTFPDFPPLTQPELIDESQFCDDLHWQEECADRLVCPCLHVLKVGLNSVVELVIVDETKTVGRMHHPFHLHGYTFLVTGLGQDPNGKPMSIGRAKQLERSGMLAKDFVNTSPPWKDTVSIPSTGYAVVRFNATNAGFWLMHCHYDLHLSIGMGLVLQVGETSQMVKPPTDFPKCGNYLPPVEQIDL